MLLETGSADPLQTGSKWKKSGLNWQKTVCTIGGQFDKIYKLIGLVITDQIGPML